MFFGVDVSANVFGFEVTDIYTGRGDIVYCILITFGFVYSLELPSHTLKLSEGKPKWVNSEGVYTELNIISCPKISICKVTEYSPTSKKSLLNTLTWETLDLNMFVQVIQLKARGLCTWLPGYLGEVSD